MSSSALRLLRRQVRAAWKLEENLPPDERELSSWQFVARQGDVLYLVGKGGHNTFFYRIGEKGEVQYLMPDEMFVILDKWTADRYVRYAITKGTDFAAFEKSKKQARTMAELQRYVDDKYIGRYIVGLTNDGRVARILTLKSGLTRNDWVPAK